MPARTGVFSMLSGGLLLAVTIAVAGPAVADEPPPLPEVLDIAPTHGLPAGGEVVTVHGTGFVGSEVFVQVDDAWVDPDVRSSTELTFVAPAHAAGSAHVRVIVGESVGEGPFYVYDQPVAPTPTPTPAPTPQRTGSVVVDEPGPTTAPTPTPSATGPAAGQNPTPIRPDLPPTLARTGARTADVGSVALVVLLTGLVLVRLATPRRVRVRRTR